MGLFLDLLSEEVKKMSIIQIVIGIFATIITIIAIELTIQVGV